MTNIIEQEIAEDLRELGVKSSWGGSDGIFMDSKDASKVVKLLTFLHRWCRPETKRESFNEVTEIVCSLFGRLKRKDKPLDLG